MSQKPQNQKDPEIQIEQAINQTEGFLYKNAKTLIATLVVAVVAVGGYFGYKNLVVEPKIQQANNQIYVAQQQFEQAEYQTALNGVEGVFLGFENIAKEFKGTPQANIANHYAGICHLNLGDAQEALKYLETFTQFSKSDIAGLIINAQNIGLQGDCQLELGNNNKALELYQKAAKTTDSDATAPFYMQKAAIVLYEIGNFEAALEMFKKIKAEYPNSIQSRDVNKHIALVEQK